MPPLTLRATTSGRRLRSAVAEDPLAEGALGRRRVVPEGEAETQQPALAGELDRQPFRLRRADGSEPGGRGDGVLIEGVDGLGPGA